MAHMPRNGMEWHVGCFNEEVFMLRTVLCSKRWSWLAAAMVAFLFTMGAQGARLVWDPNDPTPAGYNVYYSAPDLPLQKRPVGLDNFLDLAFLPAGTVYTFYVTAFSAEGLESDPSDTVVYSPIATAAPSIVTEPSSQTVLAGQSVSLTVFATGTPPITYQWQKNGNDLPGATSATFAISSAAVADSGQYTVRIANTVGSVLSAPAVLIVLIPPSIASQPVSQTLAEGSGLALSVGASGSGPLRYQWFKNGVGIPGATGETLIIPAVQTGDSGLYTVTVSNEGGSATSAGANVAVITPPSIVTHPQAQTVNAGAAVTLTVAVTGSVPLEYQWLKFGANIPGATAATLAIGSAAAENAGSYSVRVSNPAGTVTSAEALLNVIAPPEILAQPSPQSVAAGSTLTLSVSASGSIPLAFQWMKNGAEIPGANSATLSITPAQKGDSGSYSVRVSNGAGTATSSAADVAILSPPVITVSPASQSILIGNALNLSVQATGSDPLTYLWRKDGNVIPGAILANYAIPAVGGSDGGVYTVEVSNSAGAATSQGAVISISLPNAPSITQQPQSVNVSVGAPFQLSVGASGTGPFTYAWLKDGIVVQGANNDTYSVVSAQAGDAGTYNARVSNAGGTTLSASAVVSVGSPPSIIQQPANASVDAGLNAVFTVQASGTAPLVYRWLRAGTFMPGETGATLTIRQAKPSDAGSYQVEVSNSSGTVLSRPAQLTVTGAPTIVAQPQSRNVAFGEGFTVFVQATGVAPFNYRWIQNGLYIPGATSAQYQVAAADQTHSGSYSVEVSNAAGLVTSQPAIIDVSAALAPTIQTQPASINREPGATAIFTVAATGSGTLAYQWLKNDNLIVGATGPTLTIAAVEASNAGSYKVQISNIGGSIVSETAVLSVGTAPVITVQPVTQTKLAGTAAIFSVTATGSAPLAYRWSKNGILIDGATASTYTISSLDGSHSGTYSVEVANIAGRATSQQALLTVQIPPRITTQPTSRSVELGGATTFLVEASGTGPLLYQWSRNGTPIPGATSPTLALALISLANGGAYSVQVSGPAGSVTSESATLTVTGAPVITASPQDQTLAIGAPLALSVQASGAAPLTYQWTKNGSPINGAVSAAFAIASAQAGDSAIYAVVVSNGAGAATSAGATVSVVAPPVITLEPQSRTVNAGASVVFSVSATGALPLSYQWFKAGTPISGATSSSYSIPSAQAGDAGSYSVRIANLVGAVSSIGASLNVIVPPSITTQPVGQTLSAGQSLTLSVAAAGSVPLSYQWSRNGAGIAGATAADFVRPSAQASDSGSYSVRVTNPAGIATSATVTVTVLTAPAITTQPLSQAVPFGGRLLLQVAATGSTPLAYRWRKDGVFIAGATSDTYEIASSDTSHSGVYQVEVSNPVGTVNSQSAIVTVSLPSAPSITAQPQPNVNVNVGGQFTLAVTASGTGTLTYQWLKDGSPIPNATASTLVVSSAQPANAGTYNVRVSNPGGDTLSASAVVTVGTPPTITGQPASQSILAGADVEFSVSASGSAPLFYRWLFLGEFIPGATNSTLRITQVRSANAGAYQVEVSNNVGTVLSQLAILTVTGAPSILTQPASQTVNFGEAILLSVQATGAAPLAYRWIKDGQYIPGANGSTYGITSGDLSHSGTYSVEISNGAGTAASLPAVVTVRQPFGPVIVRQPASTNVEPGLALALSVEATGPAPLSYQWLKNQVEIPGATSAALQFVSVQSGDAGDYRVRVSNIGGAVLSELARVAIGTPPSIQLQPQPQTVVLGAPATFFVQASGSAPLAYRWRKDGVLIAGATTSTYTVAQSRAGDAGNYSIEISNFAGTVASQTVPLAVLTPPTIVAQPLSRSADFGSSTLFLVEAVGSGPLRFEWRRNGLAISGATNDSLQISPVTLSEGGVYTVQISGPGGQIVSESALLTVTGAPTVISSPQNQTIAAGSQFTLSVQATGSVPLSYQWFKNGTPVQGANSPSYTVNGAQPSDSGLYVVTVSNGAGSSTSAGATVSVLEAPAIVTQPQGQAVKAGASFTLSVSASGSAPINYQWLKFGINIPGATGPNFTIGSAGPEHAGSYSVRVSNPVGNITSSAAAISVLTAPVITLNPVGQTLNAGSTLSLTVAGSGSVPLSYQWSKDGLDIPGATSAEYLKTSVQGADAGNYSVRISNAAGSVSSISAAISVIVPPSITGQPQNLTVNLGEPIRLVVQTSGSQPLTYRWRKNGALIPGADQANFEIASAESQNGGFYVVEVSNSAGSVASQTAVVTVSLPNAPVITQGPLSANVQLNARITLTVTATGNGPLAYQWFKNGEPLPGANLASFEVASAQTSDAGSYNVRVSNSGGSSLSSAATITVGVPPTITVQPVSLDRDAGSSAQFTVQATGSAPFNYRWLRGGGYISGATNQTLLIAQVRASDSGVYQVEISNNAGVVTSQPATLTVTGAPVIVTQPRNRQVQVTEFFVLGVQASGAQPLAYRWIKNGSYIPGANTSEYQVLSADLTHSGSYSVEVSNGAGVVQSQPAIVSVVLPPAPSISTQPASTNLQPGGTLDLAVVASGNGPFTYQWLKNQNAIAGATAASFRIASVQGSDAGSYRVQVGNIGGSTLSVPATVTVGTPPAIATQPLSQSVASGSPATFTVSATGTAPLSYRWSKAGVLIVGATSETLFIPQVSSSHAGNYVVEVVNIAGSVASQPALLTVTGNPDPGTGAAPSITLQPASRSADIGSSTTFIVEATGAGRQTYAWIRNGSYIPNATNASLVIAPVRLADAGTYLVEVTGAGGSVVSDPATLTVAGAPSIVSSPQGQSISVGNPLALSVQVTGVAPFNYRWIKSGAYIPNATSPTFSIPSVQLTDAGSYSVEVSNNAGSTISSPAFVQVLIVPTGNPGGTVGTPPTITRHPNGVTVEVGGAATFTVEAAGTSPLSYRWIRNGSYISGATSPILTISATTLADAGTYTVEVSNGAGSVASEPANLSVVGAPTIRVHPQGANLTTGSALTLFVEATGAPPLTYNWIKGGSFITGATGPMFVIPAVQTSDAGSYTVQVANGAGQAVSLPAVVAVQTVSTNPPDPTGATAPAFTRHPGSQTVEVGRSATFSVETTGSAPLTYRWIRNGSYIAGASSATYNIAETKVSDAGVYTVEVSNTAATIVSQGASLNVVGAPRIITHPRSETVTVGNVLALSVEVTGTAPMNFRWIKGGSYLPGATNVNFIVPSAQPSDAGTYSVQVANAAGDVYSQFASVTVLPVSTNNPGSDVPTVTPPFVTRDPASQSVEIGGSVNLSIEASGSAPLAFRWIRNGSYVPGAESPTLTIPSVRLADGGSYSVEISNDAGTILSKPGTLTIVGGPAIVRHPSSQSLTVSNTLALSVEVTGAQPLTFRWIKGGSYIVGATNQNFVIPVAQLGDAGNYSVQISNAAGEVVSLAASVTVAPVETGSPGGTNPPPQPPIIARHPSSQSVAVGSGATFSVEAASTLPISYRWIRNGSYIPGASSAVYTIPQTRVADSGTYTVEVSNSAGAVFSLPAVLSIGGGPVIGSHPQGQSLTVGDPLSLTVGVTGANPLSFRWIKGGSYILGATNQSFTIPAVQLNDSGTYAVEISNGAGQVISLGATVRVSPPPPSGPGGPSGPVVPVITLHPADQVVEAGAETVFTVEASAPSPLTYSWIRNGSYVPGATSAVLRLPVTQLSDKGAYTVQISSTNATVISQTATLLVVGEPEVIIPPESQEAIAGSPLFLYVEVAGAQPMAYRWVKNGSYIPNATNSFYTVDVVRLSDAGTYWVEISNAAGDTVSDRAVVTIGGAPTILEQPANRTISIGSRMELEVSISGAPPLTYRWIKGGSYIPGANSSVYTVASVQLSDAAIYSLEVSNDAGMVTCDPFQVTVTGAPVIIEHPASQTIAQGSPLNLTVDVAGVPPFAFRWIKGGSYIASNANGQTYSIPSAQVSDSGAYSVEVSNGAGQVISQIASVQVTSTNTGSTGGGTGIVITQQPASQVADAGTEVEFAVAATGPAQLFYRWARNGSFLTGSTQAVLRLPNLKLADAGTYTVEITSSNRTAVSAGAVLTVVGAPLITSQPQSQSVPINGRLELSVSVRGAQPMKFAWIKQGSYIPNATNATLVISPVKLTDGGNYSVEISNGAGGLLSRVAQVSVTGAPVIRTPPASQVVPLGSPLNLTVEVDGTAPFIYKWIKGGGFITGATNSVFTIPAIAQSDAGTYQVEVSNGAGQVLSAGAIITTTNQLPPAEIKLALRKFGNGAVELSITAAPGSYELQRTVNFEPNSWETILTTNLATQSTIQVSTGTAPRGFFRLVRAGTQPPAPPSVKLSRRSGVPNAIDLTITGQAGNYEIQRSLNLGASASWEMLLRTNISGTASIPLTSGPAPRNFYRAMRVAN